MKPKCSLIIDSCCDLPYDMVAQDGVYLLEFPYFDSKGEHHDDLYQSVSAHDFFEGMRNGEEPTTAQLSMESLRKAFLWAAEMGKPAVYLGFTSGLSGTFDLANLVLDQMKSEAPDLEIYLVDTKLASTAEAFIVYEALRQWENGMTAKELADWVEESRYFVRCHFMVEDLVSLHRGGRIPASVATVGSKLDVKPLLTIDIDGKLALTGVVRGRKKGLKALVDFYKKNRLDESPSQTVVTGNADCEKDVKKLGELILEANPEAQIIETSIGPVIGSHVGPGMVSICFWGKDVREDVSVADRIASRIKGK